MRNVRKGQITAQEVRKLAKIDGLHRVGLGLYLRVRGGSCLWTFRVMVAGRAHEISLGSFPMLSLADAVAKAAAARAAIKRGEPIDTVRPRRPPKPQPKAVHTFSAVALHLWESMKPGWKNPKHAEQWISTLRTMPSRSLATNPLTR